MSQPLRAPGSCRAVSPPNGTASDAPRRWNPASNAAPAWFGAAPSLC